MYMYRLILFLVFAGYLFSPVLMDWWGDSSGSWYRPYLVWGALIGISIWLEQKRKLDEL